MSCTETGYNEAIECECKPCPDCEGEGEIGRYVRVGWTQSGLPRERYYSYTCVECRGTGKYSFDCGVHQARVADVPSGAFDPRFAITAEQLGIEETPVRKPASSELPAEQIRRSA